MAAFKDRRNPGRRGAHTVGLVSTLGSYEYLPLWHTLFDQLGYSVMVPDRSRTARFQEQAEASIPSENTCSPAKSVHANIL